MSESADVPRTRAGVGLVNRDFLLVTALWASLGVSLASITGRVGDWFGMSDEMRYERLAISIARMHSLAPHIHGVGVASYSQLYPLLIAPAFANGHVPHDLHVAHLVNAWVMSSACIPAFLLARRVTSRRWAAYLVGALAVCVPWIFFATMLMTEVAAYPAFLWAILFLQRAIARPSARNDLLALVGLALAYFARAQLIVLVVVLPLAVLAHELGRPGRRRPTALRSSIEAHRVLAVAYVLLVAGGIGLKASGHFDAVFGVYANAGHDMHPLPGHGFAGAVVTALATFSLGLGILPFVVGTAWLLANLVLPSMDRERHAFACLGAIAVVAFFFQVSAFDVPNGNFVHDRLLIYLAPLLVLAAVCALTDRQRPRWSLLLPGALVVLGFAFGAIPETSWASDVPINGDNPAGLFYGPVVRLVHGLSGARVLLAVGTAAAMVLFVIGAARLQRARLTAVSAALLLLVMPAETGYAFVRFFAINGTSSRPLTTNMNGVYDWVDRAVGPGADVTMVPYPVSSDYFVNQRAWWDYEFWNKSVDRDLHYPYSQVFESTGIWFPKIYVHFDSATGTSSVTLSRYILTADQETRFRFSGAVRVQQQGVMLIDATQPWRLDWLTFGLYEDGWTKPGVPVRIRIFPSAVQKAARLRNLTLAFRAPDGVPRRQVEVRSNRTRWRGDDTSATTRVRVAVCVPARGSAEVVVRATGHSEIPPNLRNLDDWTMPGRQGGIFLGEIALADEVGGTCTGSGL